MFAMAGAAHPTRRNQKSLKPWIVRWTSRDRVRDMLDLFELARWRDELVESFSHGMKQRLVMSAAFMHRPEAVLVDEPMVGLDPRGARLIKDVFRRMAERGVAILMSTHTLEVAQEMCDLVSIILKGKIIAS
jgi:ABC-2 type transport system ATP-binding protein